MSDEAREDLMRCFLEVAYPVADQIIEHLKDWVKARKQTISDLNSIAKSLNDHKGATNAAKFGGTAGSIAGGVFAVAGGITAIVASGGLAAPFIIGGGIGVGIGTAVSVGADIEEGAFINNKCKDVENAKEKDIKCGKRYESSMNELDSIIDRYDNLGMDQDSLRMIAMTRVINPRYLRLYDSGTNRFNSGSINMLKMILKIDWRYALLSAGLAVNVIKVGLQAGVKGGSNFLVKGGGTMTMGGIKLFLKTGGKLAGTALAAGTILWDVYELTRLIQSDCKSPAAKRIKEIVTDMEKQLTEFEDFLEELK